MTRRRLTYSEYINDRAIIEALRIPQPAPEGQDQSAWPTWHLPGVEPIENHSVEWSPGESWPRVSGNWCHHEVLFIRVHQAFEVWFSVALHELDEVLADAISRAELEGRRIHRVELGERAALAREFPPLRFPQLANVAKSFRKDFLRNQVFLLPAPGRHELSQGSLIFSAHDLERWSLLIDRAKAALAVAIPFFDVLASLRPSEFMEFRGRLAPASGFGSTQFRELEMALGLRELTRSRIAPPEGASSSEMGELPQGMLRPTVNTPPQYAQTAFFMHHVPSDWPRLTRRWNRPSLRDLVYGILNANIFGWEGAAKVDAALDRFAALNIRQALSGFDAAEAIDEGQVAELVDGLGEVLSHRETTVAALVTMKHDTAALTAIHRFLESCLALDATLLRWRDHHIRFVEGIIGRRPGTGGAGVNYLRSTVDSSLATYLTHALPCLWQARTVVQRDAV